MVHDLVDHDIVLELERVRLARRGHAGVQPIPVVLRRSPAQPTRDATPVDHALAVGRQQQQAIVFCRLETQLLGRHGQQTCPVPGTDWAAHSAHWSSPTLCSNRPLTSIDCRAWIGDLDKEIFGVRTQPTSLITSGEVSTGSTRVLPIIKGRISTSLLVSEEFMPWMARTF